MKLVLALAVLATSAASVAASRDIYDIMYLPNAGTTYGFTTGSYQDVTQEEDSNETEISGYLVEQTLGHAISDRLTLQATLDYTSIEENPEEGKTIDASKGISDPTVAARFRMMDEDFRWDIIGGATLSIMDREAEVDDDSNIDYDNLQGGHSLFVGTQFGGKSESFQWAVLGQITHRMEAETEYQTSANDVKADRDAHNVLLLRGDILNKLAEKSFLRTHLGAEFTEESEEDIAGVKFRYAPATVYEVGTEYQHLASQDLLLRVGVDYAQINARSGQIDEFTGWKFNVGANYQF